MTQYSIEEICNDIKEDIESQNIRDDETGEYRYDVTRLTSELDFDCEIKIDDDVIDLRVKCDEDGEVEAIDIQDYDIAEKYGINEDDIQDKIDEA